MNKEQILEKTQEGGGSDTPKNLQSFGITILNRYEEFTAVKVVANEYIDYLHIANQEGKWLIVNSLWTDNRERR